MFRKLTKHNLVKILLSKREAGQMEVRCKFGRVDVVTKAEAIEVKNYRYWKQALGQALVYGQATGKLPRVHLYGNQRLPQDYEETIGNLGVRLSYHWDPEVDPEAYEESRFKHLFQRGPNPLCKEARARKKEAEKKA